MKNKVMGLVLVGILSVGMVGCGNNEAKKLQGTKITGEMDEMVVEEKPKYNFDEHNILTFGEIEVDNTPEYEGDEYIDFKCKVTNNSKQMIKTVTVDFSYYDKDGVMLSSTHPQEGNSIPSGNSFYIDSLFNSTEYKVNEIKITSYSYYIGDVYYEVDLMSETIEIFN